MDTPAQCRTCGFQLSSSSPEGVCPNCGARAELPETPGIIRRYFQELKSVLTQPASFFRNAPVSGGLAYPLTFALVTHWIGSALGYVWSSLSGAGRGRILEEWLKRFGDSDQIDMISRNARWIEAREHLTDWFWGVGSVIVDPFTTLLSIVITAFFVYIGARILVSRVESEPRSKEVTYESAARILCFATAASIFGVIPFFGPAIAWIYGIYIAMVGAREFYRVKTGRALVIVLFPKILLLAVILLSVFLVLFAALQFFMSVF